MPSRDYAARNRRPAPKKKGGLPAWVWAIVGLSGGLLVAAIVYISRPAPPMRGTVATYGLDDPEPAKGSLKRRDFAKEKEAARQRDKVTIPPKEKARFTFYELLPSQEVLVPSQELPPPKPAAPTPKPGTAASSNWSTAQPAQPVPAPAVNAAPAQPVTRASPARAAAPAVAAPSPAAPPATTASAPAETYVIQVASYRSPTEADKRKAALAMLGVESRIEKVTIDNRDTFYRVRVGPLQDAARAASVKSQLEANGMAPVIVKMR